MHLEALNIFCDVVRHQSFSRGALANSISQSAASQAVRQIERRLGTQLIDRSKRPLQLTPEGKVFFKGCQEIVERYHQLASMRPAPNSRTAVAWRWISQAESFRIGSTLSSLGTRRACGAVTAWSLCPPLYTPARA